MTDTPTPRVTDEPCVAALLQYQQADEDGVMVLASRQAIHETVDELIDSRALAQSQAATIAERDAEIERLKAPIAERYCCQRCGRRDGLDAVVPDFMWSQISAAADNANILCLWCIDEIALGLGMRGAAALHFAGRALHASSDIRFAESIMIAVRSATALAIGRAEAAESANAALTERLARAEAALKSALPQAEGCFANHYGDNPEGATEPEHIRLMRAALTPTKES